MSFFKVKGLAGEIRFDTDVQASNIEAAIKCVREFFAGAEITSIVKNKGAK